jgi:bifunctional DNA-binding transcriptional regulator/antitoxin component of YhaV-PrlF toxin-antitoxin module
MLMATIRITAKRQATLPAALCDELGVQPGDDIQTERRVVKGETVWVLRARKLDWSWFGAAKHLIKRRSHRWEDIEKNIEKGWAEDDRA